MELNRLNNMSESEASIALKRCCGAQKWVDKMLSAMPFESGEQLFAKAKEYLHQLDRKDWLEAFSHHPKIGDLEVLRQKFNVNAQWEAGEQSGVATATDKILHDLAEGNKQYEEKFGYIFIVCATGKSAEEMLNILQSRLPNDPNTELKIAAGEQSKITMLRLEKVCQ